MELDPPPPPSTNSPFSIFCHPSTDLELNFQNLNLAPKEEIQIDLEDQSQEQISTQYNLLFKVGPPVGSASRNISLNIFETAMRAAWGHRFYRVSQIVPNLFMAHFKEEDDLRWIWQRQPWLIGKDTLLVEWIDPKGGTPMESFKFQYLPVTVHIYGIPKTFRSMDLVKKIVEKIGFKDESVVFSENAMFKAQEFVMARVILDVSKPLIDCLTIKISEEKKLKIYVHYEKLAKICSFCGCLFHNVSACLKRQQILWKLGPSEAGKIPEEVYGKWRIIESEIPKEAKEQVDSKAHNAYIQSFKDYFQNLAESSSSSSNNQKGNPDQSINKDMQLILSPSSQLSSLNAKVADSSKGSQQPLQETNKGNQEGGNKGNELGYISQCTALAIPVMGQVNQEQQSSGMVGSQYPTGIFNYQAQQYQAQLQFLQQQLSFSKDQQWQQQMNPFLFHGSSQFPLPNLQAINSEGSQSNERVSVQALDLPPSQPKILALSPQCPKQNTDDSSQLHISSSSAMPNFFKPNQVSYLNQHGINLHRKHPKKKSYCQSPIQATKRQGSPLHQPPSKKPPSLPIPFPPNSLPLSTSPPHQATIHNALSASDSPNPNPRSRRHNGGHSSRWDQGGSDGSDAKNHHRPVQAESGTQADYVADVSAHTSVHCSGVTDPGGDAHGDVSQISQDDQVCADQAADGALAPAHKAPRAP